LTSSGCILIPQLAEAILSDPGNVANLEEVGSIRVTDTRTWRPKAYGDTDERQFLVGDEHADEEEHREGAVRDNGQPRPPLDEENEDRPGSGRLGIMDNAGARLSRLDIRALNGDADADDGLRDNVSVGGLSAKAGIVLVRYICQSQIEPFR